MQCGVRARELGGVSSTAVLGVLVRGVQLGVGVLLSVWDTPLYSRYVEKRERACRNPTLFGEKSPEGAGPASCLAAAASTVASYSRLFCGDLFDFRCGHYRITVEVVEA